MTRALDEIGLDSHCLSYVIDVLEGAPAPSDSLAEQRIALARTYLYTQGTLWTLPTVAREFARISDPVRRQKHESWTNVLFGIRPVEKIDAVERRAADLASLHRDQDDRMLLAEAEHTGCTVLLSFDRDLIKHLAGEARLTLTTPALFWESLGIPQGATPDKIPARGNPLADDRWWEW